MDVAKANARRMHRLIFCRLDPDVAGECPICLQQMRRGFVTPCGHAFHCRCLRRCQGNRCPMCRADLPVEHDSDDSDDSLDLDLSHFVVRIAAPRRAVRLWQRDSISEALLGEALGGALRAREDAA